MTEGRFRHDRCIQTTDIAEAAMLAVRTSSSCVPSEITLRLSLSAALWACLHTMNALWWFAGCPALWSCSDVNGIETCWLCTWNYPIFAYHGVHSYDICPCSCSSISSLAMWPRMPALHETNHLGISVEVTGLCMMRLRLVLSILCNTYISDIVYAFCWYKNEH